MGVVVELGKGQGDQGIERLLIKVVVVIVGEWRRRRRNGDASALSQPLANRSLERHFNIGNSGNASASRMWSMCIILHYVLRNRALYNDLSRYTCYGGFMPNSGHCGENTCPKFCLVLR
ncbi:hypothetical protein ACH5RR_000163 [Cinchona calisaya]|uniref:Uncharacterized protein n=1 Tax=Cinchona calisaya TaxID=153742 RepID=A0ABD3AZV3_9GENT